MKKCSFCAEEIQDEAIKCRYCGEFLDGRETPQRTAAVGYPYAYWGYEYRSKTELFGLPLVHIAQGIDPQTGRFRVAKGIIAIGNVAIGGLAIGGISIGAITLGGLTFGILALGGVAIGVVAMGGIALAVYLAMGGMAISLTYAIGGLAIAPHTISPAGTDPELIEKLRKLFPGMPTSIGLPDGRT